MITRKQKYKVHTANVRSVQTAITHVYLSVKKAIRSGKIDEANSLFKVMLSQVAILAEVKLLKLLHEPDGFSQEQIDIVIGRGSQLEMWNTTVELAFSSRFNVPVHRLVVPHISFENHSRLQEILRILQDDFEPFILLRNKLTHGQWARCLNSDNSEYDIRAMAIINTENALSLNHKLKMLGHLQLIIHDLVVSTAFARDFSTHYNSLVTRRTEVGKVNYENWCVELQEREKKGKLKFFQNLTAQI